MGTLLYTKCHLYVYCKYNTYTWRRNEVIYIYTRLKIIALSKINTGSYKTKP